MDDMAKTVKEKMKLKNQGGETFYGIGLVGALVYYLQGASTFGEGVLGVLKALVWPAFLVHKLMGFLGM